LIFIDGRGKGGAFVQQDYLKQVLEPAIEVILTDFALVTSKIRFLPSFIEDSNPAHSHKSINNPCALFRASKGIDILDHPSTSPDLNPIKKC